MRREVHIGMVGVVPAKGSDLLGNAKGAYVNVLALASTPQEYEDEVQRALGGLGLFAFEFEDVEPFANRASQRSLEADLYVLAAEVSETGQPRFATFHTFANVDA